MLYRRRDYMLALLGVFMSHAFYGHVIGFSAARGEEYFIGRGVYGGGNLIARVFHTLARFAPESVNARSVAVDVGKVRHHCVEHIGAQLCGRRIVHVNFH